LEPVIFRVLLTEAMRPLISFKLGIPGIYDLQIYNLRFVRSSDVGHDGLNLPGRLVVQLTGSKGINDFRSS